MIDHLGPTLLTTDARITYGEGGGRQQPVVKRELHSAGDASPPTALLLPHI